MHDGERQVAPTVSGIRRDHVARYEWAASLLPRGTRIIDAACGVGYGAYILGEAGHRVYAFDIDEEAIEYAMAHYPHPNVTYRVGDVTALPAIPPCDVAVAFEVIEHLSSPATMLAELGHVAPRLLASVPNESVFPFRGYRFHERHYTAAEFRTLLNTAGYRVAGWHGQAGPESEVEPGLEGRTIVVEADRLAKESAEVPFASSERLPAPEHVVILGLGPSLEAYVDIVKRLGSRRAFADEVWGINAVADIIQCDRVFHMDDVEVQEIRAAARPDSNIANMLSWLRTHPGPIYTSRVKDDYPGLVPYPLEDVINSCGWAYFNSTAAYAVAYAVHIGVKKIALFGIDFTYRDSHMAEKGRGCVEFHLGIAAARGIEIGLPPVTSLMDANAPADERVYGYDAYVVAMAEDAEGAVKVTLAPKDRLPTADEIEARYDHSRHPNRLVKG